MNWNKTVVDRSPGSLILAQNRHSLPAREQYHKCRNWIHLTLPCHTTFSSARPYLPALPGSPRPVAAWCAVKDLLYLDWQVLHSSLFGWSCSCRLFICRLRSALVSHLADGLRFPNAHLRQHFWPRKYLGASLENYYVLKWNRSLYLLKHRCSLYLTCSKFFSVIKYIPNTVTFQFYKHTSL